MSNTAGATSGERTATEPEFVSVFFGKIHVVHFVQLHDLHF